MMNLEEGCPMETMNVALPESMKQFVQERVSAGGYSSVSEYIRELIRADQSAGSRSGSTPCFLKGSIWGADPRDQRVLGGEEAQVHRTAGQDLGQQP